MAAGVGSAGAARGADLGRRAALGFAFGASTRVEAGSGDAGAGAAASGWASTGTGAAGFAGSTLSAGS